MKVRAHLQFGLRDVRWQPTFRKVSADPVSSRTRDVAGTGIYTTWRERQVRLGGALCPRTRGHQLRSPGGLVTG
jgi:hypothetical protein